MGRPLPWGPHHNTGTTLLFSIISWVLSVNNTSSLTFLATDGDGEAKDDRPNFIPLLAKAGDWTWDLLIGETEISWTALTSRTSPGKLIVLTGQFSSPQNDVEQLEKIKKDQHANNTSINCVSAIRWLRITWLSIITFRGHHSWFCSVENHIFTLYSFLFYLTYSN